MILLKQINQGIAFLLELLMLFMLGKWGYQLGKGTVWKFALAIGLPMLAIVLWGHFAAPKSTHRLAFPYLSLFHICMFSGTAWVWYKAGHPTAAIVFMLDVLLSEFIAVVLKQ